MVGNKYRIVTNSVCTKTLTMLPSRSIHPLSQEPHLQIKQFVVGHSPLSLSDSIGTIQWQLSTDSVTFDISGSYKFIIN
jgi:hypothetical protein